MEMANWMAMFLLRQESMVKRNQNGMSMVEILMTVAIMSFLIMVVFGILINSQRAYHTADADIDLRNQLRIAIEKLSSELRNTGLDGAGNAQYTVFDGAGAFSTDTIRFSMPIYCSATSSFLDASGNPSYWGAPLNYGCNSYTCMDQNGDCSTLEYKYLWYMVDGNNQLLRIVANAAGATVASTVVARNISNLQATVSNDGTSITYTITASKLSAMRTTATVTLTETVNLMNRGA